VSSCLSGKTIALAVTGSIAAYKAVLVARLLVGAGAKVVTVMTKSAAEFVGPVTFAGITGHPVRTSMWDASFPGEMHVELASQADLVLVVPATADVLARFAQGRADDLVTALVLCAKVPVLVAPAMHPNMWEHPGTQANVATLARQGRVTLVGPVSGPVASGDDGMGRMAEPSDIVKAALALLGGSDLAGVRLVVTAGPTEEALDPVRFLGNRSTGTMGFALAERAAARGARVTLIAGPVPKPTPRGVTRVDVTSALAMQSALADAMGPALDRADALVMAAAVADYRPKDASPAKMKRAAQGITVELVPNPDLLADVGARRTTERPLLVGFALETVAGDALIAHARKKLAAKKVDLVVANTVETGLGGETSEAILVTAGGATTLPSMSKKNVADAVLDWVSGRVARRSPG
jgi:phosphopantothenoylcysteine decarboxylase/phosphopantothenate--cysteine ligase